MDSLVKCFGSWYVIVEDLNICGHIVPKGFISDGCSCPRVLKKFFTSEEILIASILHDYLYYRKFGFRLSNRIFYNILRKLGVGNIRSYLIFLAVSIFGYSRYN